MTTFPAKSIRSAITLLELIAVVAIAAIFVTVAASRIGPETIRDFGARADARRLAADLHQARRRSIATGENHYLAFTGGGTATGYTLYRRDASAGNVAVDEPHVFPSGVVVASSNSQVEFNFEGSALAAYKIVLTGPSQTWQVDLVPATGMAVVTQTAP